MKNNLTLIDCQIVKHVLSGSPPGSVTVEINPGIQSGTVRRLLYIDCQACIQLANPDWIQRDAIIVVCAMDVISISVNSRLSVCFAVALAAEPSSVNTILSARIFPR